jgi:hypothetical protein
VVQGLLAHSQHSQQAVQISWFHLSAYSLGMWLSKRACK